MSELGFVSSEESLMTSGGGRKLVAMNTLSWRRSEIVKLPWMDTTYGLAQGAGLSTLEIRPLSAPLLASTASIEEIRTGVFELRNTQFVVQVTDGAITSLFDKKAHREGKCRCTNCM
jgi:alpha-mannosidase